MLETMGLWVLCGQDRTLGHGWRSREARRVIFGCQYHELTYRPAGDPLAIPHGFPRFRPSRPELEGPESGSEGPHAPSGDSSRQLFIGNSRP